jgi:hypothetical protein
MTVVPRRRLLGTASSIRRDIAENQLKELFMTEGTGTIIYPVKDIAQAERLYSELLGVKPSMCLRQGRGQ